MIRRVRLGSFKRFGDQTFELDEATVLVGPNNSGKSTLLQAIATWRFGLDCWVSQREHARKSAKRTGVAIVRGEFTAVPIRDMSLLWTDRVVSGGNGPGPSRLLEIVVEGKSNGDDWECGLEFQYANRELIYVRPCGAKHMAEDELAAFPPQPAKDLQIVRVPALSGIQRDEPRHQRGMQDLLIGQGRSGDILRNLLLEIGGETGEPTGATAANDDWTALTSHVRDLFGIDLMRPVHGAGQPYITCEYRERPDASPKARKRSRTRPLDLASAGSGTLQVILLLAFLYARRGAVMLMDDPDAHQHVVLQRETHALLHRIARERGGQLVMATHSPTMLDTTDPERVLSFGDTPLPREHKVPNARTRRAMAEAEEMMRQGVVRFATADEMFSALERDAERHY